MSYKDYQNARDASWRILLDCEVGRLPVDLNVICSKLHIKVRTYASAEGLVRKIGARGVTDGVLLYHHNQPLILYDGDLPSARIRFTVAHEIGHLVLGHVAPGQRTTINRELSPTDSPLETAANQFAARLLAPACVLWGLGLHGADEIASACHISMQAASFRADRMEHLYARNKFLTSPLEREVYNRFLPYMEEIRGSRDHHRQCQSRQVPGYTQN